MSKRGSPYLVEKLFSNNKLLWLPPLMGPLSSQLFIKRNVPKVKHHLTAIGAVARKMCNIVFTVLKNNTTYKKKFNDYF